MVFLSGFPRVHQGLGEMGDKEELGKVDPGRIWGSVLGKGYLNLGVVSANCFNL